MSWKSVNKTACALFIDNFVNADQKKKHSHKSIYNFQQEYLLSKHIFVDKCIPEIVNTNN